MTMLFRGCLVAICALAVCLTGCKSAEKKKGSKTNTENVFQARAIISPTVDNTAYGIVTFTQERDGVRVAADIGGLKPGRHGFHIHEKGDCSAPDASSAGGHYNPTNKKHGAPDSPERHVGDLGNIMADDDGHGYYERLDRIIELNGANSIIGKSVIVHADYDDYISQPAGNAGARLGCGVIEPLQK